MTSALILFAHGARDAAWAEPFERVLREVQARVPDRAPMLAFLDMMTPDLPSAIDAQVRRGYASVRIVPLFLGPGGHLRHDLPRIVDEARARHPEVAIHVAPAAGDDPRVVSALAAYCLD